MKWILFLGRKKNFLIINKFSNPKAWGFFIVVFPGSIVGLSEKEPQFGYLFWILSLKQEWVGRHCDHNIFSFFPIFLFPPSSLSHVSKPESRFLCPSDTPSPPSDADSALITKIPLWSYLQLWGLAFVDLSTCKSFSHLMTLLLLQPLFSCHLLFSSILNTPLPTVLSPSHSADFNFTPTWQISCIIILIGKDL